MLKSVYIKNYALVQEGEIEFSPGLNIFTGETGAGKSIIVGAIGTLLGERTSPSVIRAGETKAIVEGHFDLHNLPAIRQALREKDLDSGDDSLIVRREIASSGRSRAFINDTPVTLDELESLANRLVDLHGQHEHQSLLRTAEHLTFLDAYGKLHAEAAAVAKAFRDAEALRHELESLQKQEKTLREKREYLAFQLQEMQKIDPQPGEQEELLAEEKRLAHGAELLEKCALLNDLLYEREGSVIESLGTAVQNLDDLRQVDDFFSDLRQNLESSLIEIDEVVKAIRSYASRVQVNPDRLEAVRSRLAEFAYLQKKYAAPIAEIIRKKTDLAAELARIDSLEDKIREIDTQWQQAIVSYLEVAQSLSALRQQAATRLEREIPRELAEIGMPGTTFVVKIGQERTEHSWLQVDGQPLRASSTGLDRVEFYISANPGQPPRPLSKVASGGEISRIMLALKGVIAHLVQVPVLIFDEIDMGISGRIAEAVGRKLQRLANTHQIVCITHLPQIASAGTTHFQVEKWQQDDTTTTNVRRLTQDERELAIAQLLGGENITDSHIASAKELLRQAAIPVPDSTAKSSR